ncbi:MAG: hypothetical protein IJR49_03425 [Treponema sp.]|nr:hypothetical protein [Treponema sp.]
MQKILKIKNPCKNRELIGAPGGTRLDKIYFLYFYFVNFIFGHSFPSTRRDALTLPCSLGNFARRPKTTFRGGFCSSGSLRSFESFGRIKKPPAWGGFF